MYGGVCSLGVNVRRRGVCVIVDNEVGSFFGFVVNMLCSVPLLPLPPNIIKMCVHPCYRLAAGLGLEQSPVVTKGIGNTQ